MSSQSAQVQALVLQYHLLVVSNWCGTAANALWLYDFLLTLPSEVSSIWKSKFSGVTVLYIFNRYGFLLAVLVNLATSYEVNPTDKFCGDSFRVAEALIITQTISGPLILFMRLYAIYQKAWWIAVILAILQSINLTANILDAYIFTDVASAPPFGCANNVLNLAQYTRWNTVTIALSLAGQTLIFALTVLKTISIVLQARRLGLPQGLSYYLFRDGTLFYIPLFAFYVILLCIILVPKFPPFLQLVVEGFSTPLTNILINRLVLSLKSIRAVGDADERTNYTMPNLNFATNPILGNIGAPLTAPGEDAEKDAFIDVLPKETVEDGDVFEDETKA